MLGKLLKYEFKATARIFLLMYAALLVVAAISAALYAISGSILSGTQGVMPMVLTVISSIFTVIYVLVAIAVMVVTVVVIIMRFYRMLGNEGYLWFTLPATANQHLLSKLITSLVWTIAGTLMVCISILILALPAGWISYLGQLPQAWNALVSVGINPGAWLAGIAVFLIITVIFGNLMFYTAMAIGPNLTKSRLGGSVLAYIILYICSQVVGVVELLILLIPLSSLNGNLSIDISVNATDNIAPVLTQITPTINSAMLALFICFGVGYLAMSVVLYLLSKHFMTKKLNLV